MATSASSASFEDLLAQLELAMRMVDPRLANHLRPGASDEQLQAFEIDLGHALPPGFAELYRWHDGSDPVFESLPVIGDWHPLFMLPDLYGRTSMFLGFDETRDWLPISDGAQMTAVVVDLASTSGRVLGVDHENEMGSCESLAEMVSEMINVVEAGGFEYNPRAGGGSTTVQTDLPLDVDGDPHEFRPTWPQYRFDDGRPPVELDEASSPLDKATELREIVERVRRVAEENAPRDLLRVQWLIDRSLETFAVALAENTPNGLQTFGQNATGYLYTLERMLRYRRVIGEWPADWRRARDLSWTLRQLPPVDAGLS